MRIFLLPLLFFTLVGYWNAEGFVQNSCKIGPISLVVGFSDNRTQTTFTVDFIARLVTFKGATDQDMQWGTNLDGLESLHISSNFALQVELKHGETYELGIITKECISIINSKLSQLVIVE